MYAATFVSVFAFAASVAAAPASWSSDPSVCAPGTGYYQVCASSGYKGCCAKDACSLGYCPTDESIPSTPTPPPTNNHPVDNSDGTCSAGMGYYVCHNGFKGCCSSDPCALKTAYCPDWYAPELEPPVYEGERPVVVDEHHEVPQPVDGMCPRGTGYYQVCGSKGFKGCSTKDECAPKYQRRWECAAGTGYYQVCANGFKGCSTRDECSAPSYTPAPAPAPVPAPTPAPGTCAPDTGYYQVCGPAQGGFKGCCKADACGLGYCPY